MQSVVLAIVLRSATCGDLVVSPTVTHFGTRSFAIAGPKDWNHLPTDIRAIDAASAFRVFSAVLKALAA